MYNRELYPEDGSIELAAHTFRVKKRISSGADLKGMRDGTNNVAPSAPTVIHPHISLSLSLGEVKLDRAQ